MLPLFWPYGESLQLAVRQNGISKVVSGCWPATRSNNSTRQGNAVCMGGTHPPNTVIVFMAVLHACTCHCCSQAAAMHAQVRFCLLKRSQCQRSRQQFLLNKQPQGALVSKIYAEAFLALGLVGWRQLQTSPEEACQGAAQTGPCPLDAFCSGGFHMGPQRNQHILARQKFPPDVYGEKHEASVARWQFCKGLSLSASGGT